MGLTDDILTILFSYHDGYRLMRRKLSGASPFSDGRIYRGFEDASDSAIRVTLSRLKKRGFVENKKGIWRLTKAGRGYFANKISLFPTHSEKTAKRNPKSIVISFDVPEIHKKKRDWLRAELLCLGFEMLQKSLWLGPAPLPEQFVESLRKLQLFPYIKFFEAKEAEII